MAHEIKSNYNLNDEKINELKSFLKLMVSESQLDETSLSEFIREYVNLISNTRSTAYLRSIVTSFQYLLFYFGADKKLGEIATREVEKLILKLKSKTPKGYRVYFRNYLAAFNKAKEWNYVKENLFSKIKLSKLQKNKPAYIKLYELNKILDFISIPTVRIIIKTAFYTGCRLGELLNLKVMNVDLVEGIIIIGDNEFTTKGKKQRIVPISKHIINDLIQLIGGRKPCKQYLFAKSNNYPFSKDYISKTFKKACRKAGISEDIHFHSLRHSFGSLSAQANVPLISIKEIMGHSSLNTTCIYLHVNKEELKRSMNILDEAA